jgi:hypothetical protein
MPEPLFGTFYGRALGESDMNDADADRAVRCPWCNQDYDGSESDHCPDVSCPGYGEWEEE